MLESIIEQTYNDIQLILINNGSTDKTDEVINQYADILNQRCSDFICILQDNKGASAAINTGLKHVKGEYLIWADSDDFFEKNSIQARVEFLETHSEYDVVACRGWIVAEDNIEKRLGEVNLRRSETVDIEQLIRNFIVPVAGFYMIRTSVFFKYNPLGEIYEAKVGQNWQILLSTLPYCKCRYLEEHLFNVVKRTNSDSRRKFSKAELWDRYNEMEAVIIETIKRMDMENKTYYIKMVKEVFEPRKEKYKKSHKGENR